MTDEECFSMALEQAELAAARGEVPIGAVLVKDGRILSKDHNRTEEFSSFTEHAEMRCLRDAGRRLNDKYLVGSKLFVTLEPCLMCQTAARLCRVDQILFLTRSEKFGSAGPAYPKIEMKEFTTAQSQRAILLLHRFFEDRR